jgi:hypothetical protein
VEVDEYDIDPAKETQVLVSTASWKAFDIAARTPRARGCWVEVHEQEGDEGEKFFTQKLGVWKVGAWMEDAEWVLRDVREWTV